MIGQPISENQALLETFRDLDSPQKLAAFLEMKVAVLDQLLHHTAPQQQYSKFKIPKRSGGERQITAPRNPLKFVQRRLNESLQEIYTVKDPVHGFVPERSIVTNARVHVNQRYVLNLDLKDFFPSIKYNRVRQTFMGHPYGLNETVATCLAQLCCYENALPQGAPTSPILSNIVCAPMDDDLQLFAQSCGWTYTRYADDITFSTSNPISALGVVYVSDRKKNIFPLDVVHRLPMREGLIIQIGDEIRWRLQKHGFKINQKKVRLQLPWGRQEVTGLITNERVNISRAYVRQVRAMLHDWQTNGRDAAAERHFRLHYHKHHNPHNEGPAFEHILRGKIAFIAMVRGHDDPLYLRYRNQLIALAPESSQPLAYQP